MVKAIIGLGSLGIGASVMAAVAYLQFAPPKPVVLREEAVVTSTAQPRLERDPSAERRPNPPPLGKRTDTASRAPVQKRVPPSSNALVPCSEFSDLGPTAIAGTEAGETRSVRLLCETRAK